LHLVFLGVVTPLLVAWGLELGWLVWSARAKGGIALFLSGAALTEFALVMPAMLPTLAWLSSPPALFSSAVILALGVLLLAAAQKRAA
jgi:hypothetical protein